MDEGRTTKTYQIIFGEGSGSREESKENGPRPSMVKMTQYHIVTVPRLTARDTLRSVKWKVAEALKKDGALKEEEIDEMLSDRYQFHDIRSLNQQMLKLTERIGKIESQKKLQVATEQRSSVSEISIKLDLCRHSFMPLVSDLPCYGMFTKQPA